MTRPPPPPAAAIPHFSADLAASADGASFFAFQANSAATCEIGLREGASPAEFWFRTAMFQLPRAMLFRAAASGHTTRRGPEHIARGDAQIAIYAFVGGRSDTFCRDRTVGAGPGDVFVCDFGEPFESELEDYDAIVLMAPRERMPAEFLRPAAHGALLPAGSGGARLVHGLLATLFDAAPNLSLAEAEAAIDAVILAARACLDDALARAEHRTDRAGDDLMARAKAFIDRNLSDPSLATAHLQKHLGVSRSGLYRLFAPEGGVGAAILRRRLDGCLRRLLKGEPPDPSWLRLAADHGFRGEAQLARAFSRRFGITPRAFHGMVGRKDSAGLTAQARRAGFVTLQAWLDHVAGHAELDG